MFFTFFYRFLFDCANLGVNTSCPLVYLYIIVYFSTKAQNIRLFHFGLDALFARRREVFLLSA